jgi:hypothetical protein
MEFRKLIKKYRKSDIRITEHAKIRYNQRNLNKEFIINLLFDLNKLFTKKNNKITDIC